MAVRGDLNDRSGWNPDISINRTKVERGTLGDGALDQKQDIYDARFVKGVFDRCSERYIAFSWMCSFGFTERWRRQCIAALPPPGDAPSGYDLMAGTGEVWPHLLKRFPSIRKIVAVDISSGMHKLALERLHVHRADRIQFVEDDVLASAIPSDSADFIVSTFGLKTFNAEQHVRWPRWSPVALSREVLFQ